MAERDQEAWAATHERQQTAHIINDLLIRRVGLSTSHERRVVWRVSQWLAAQIQKWGNESGELPPG